MWTHALSEMLIRRCLSILSELAVQENQEVIVEQVTSAQNKADVLTRVPRKWLTSQTAAAISDTGEQIGGLNAALAGPATDNSVSRQAWTEVERIHRQHHFGVDRMLEIVRRKLGPRASRRLVKSVVSECQQCTSIDPAVTFRWQTGKQATSSMWECLALDVTHVNGRPYLSCIDCASHFTIWRALREESAKEVKAHLERIFAEMGPPARILSDNGTLFRAAELRRLLDAWEVEADFSCVYQAQGNGLVEHIHRTIKQMVARSGNSVETMTFWYNATKGGWPASPYEQVFAARPRAPGVADRWQEVERTWLAHQTNAQDDTRSGAIFNEFVVGDRVYLKPSDGRCDRPWSGPH